MGDSMKKTAEFKDEKAKMAARHMVDHIIKELGEVTEEKKQELFLQWYQYFKEKTKEGLQGFHPDLQK